jgi:hypothetical protein
MMKRRKNLFFVGFSKKKNKNLKIKINLSNFMVIIITTYNNI